VIDGELHWRWCGRIPNSAERLPSGESRRDFTQELPRKLLPTRAKERQSYLLAKG
jgi:hypothetical protein